MVTELDIWAIKERIIAILQNDSDLYSATGATGKLRKILTGYISDTNTSLTPMAFVTNSQRVETISPGSVISNAWKSLNHKIRFEIHVIVDGKAPEKLEEKLDDFRKLIYEVIEENNQLELVIGGSPLVATCWPESLIHEGRGTEKQKLIITLFCIAVS